LERLGLPAPRKWEDLTDQRYLGNIALADPTKSGSVAKIFEMIIQEAIADEIAGGLPEEEAVPKGWEVGLNRIKRISANARYFTDGSAKIPHDVAQGNAVAGMCIDFYGRTFEDEKRKPDGSSRVAFVVPTGGTSISVDPVAVLKGAPHPGLAQEFVEFLFTEQAQMLWAAKKGSEFGPKFRTLRRLPVRRDLYDAEHLAMMVDAEVMPYEVAKRFQYHGEWTGRLFTPLRNIVRVMGIDSHEELTAAWEAMAKAGVRENEAFNRLAAKGGCDTVANQSARKSGSLCRWSIRSSQPISSSWKLQISSATTTSQQMRSVVTSSRL
jgi:ABC-type Fe3+ transport system substrate-binding protein